MNSTPTTILKSCVDALISYNDFASNKVADQVYMGPDILVVSLRAAPMEIEAIEGDDFCSHRETFGTVDIFDLMDMHQQENQ